MCSPLELEPVLLPIELSSCLGTCYCRVKTDGFDVVLILFSLDAKVLFLGSFSCFALMVLKSILREGLWLILFQVLSDGFYVSM